MIKGIDSIIAWRLSSVNTRHRDLAAVGTPASLPGGDERLTRTANACYFSRAYLSLYVLSEGELPNNATFHLHHTLQFPKYFSTYGLPKKEYFRSIGKVLNSRDHSTCCLMAGWPREAPSLHVFIYKLKKIISVSNRLNAIVYEKCSTEIALCRREEFFPKALMKIPLKDARKI